MNIMKGDNVKTQRFFYSVGVILLFYEGYEILLTKGSIYEIFGVAGFLTITLFLGFYLLFYGLSLTSTLKEDQIEKVEDTSQNLFNAGFETAIFFVAYAALIFVFSIVLFPLRNAISFDWYFSVISLLSLISAVLIHIRIFDKEISALHNPMRAPYYLLIFILLVMTIPSIREAMLGVL